MSEAIDTVIKALEQAEGSSFALNHAIATLEFYREAEGDLADDEVPDFCGSIDAALTLVPKNWFWRCGRTSIYQAWALINEMHPDHCDTGWNEFAWKREAWEPDSTPAIALCIVALQARAVQKSKSKWKGKS